jgi:YD repeat-containing protein
MFIKKNFMKGFPKLAASLAVVFFLTAFISGASAATVKPLLPATDSFNTAQASITAVEKNFAALQVGQKQKAPKMLPASLSDLPVLVQKVSNKLGAKSLLTNMSALDDTTPPSEPSNLQASANQLSSISVTWDPATDPESGISYYAVGIGTSTDGDFSDMANVRWWQAVIGTSFSASLILDPNKTYYVSVYAINGAGLSGSFVTSVPIHPVWQNLGDPSNVMTLAFGAQGIDINGNATTTFTAEEETTMQNFYNRMYPILVQLYGAPSVSYTVTVVRDMHYSGTNIFIPSLNEIHKDDGFYPQLFTHELIHAFRDHVLLASDANWNFDTTLSPFEESFAQAVSYDAMNAYVAQYPNDDIVPGNTLYDSSYESDYDFQNMPILRGTDFWSDGGATGLYWEKYEMGAAAIRKINVESPGFYKAFNEEYYRRINADHSTRPSRALIVDIIKTVVPTIEGEPADTWIDNQNIFYAQNVYGEKIYNRVQDYPWTQFYAFQNLYFLDTMSCGSEWSCWNGAQWDYYHLNGSNGTAALIDWNGNNVWTGNLQITPTTNPSDGTYQIGSVAKSLTTASTQLPWPAGDANDYIFNINTMGLYQFNTTFTDSATGAQTNSTIYEAMGTPIANDFKGVWGGVIGHKTGIIYIDHEGYAAQAGIPVVNGAFYGARSWTGISNIRTGGTDSVPGKVHITFVDGATGVSYHAQRNIEYGNSDGSQMFLFKFNETIPSTSLTAPANGATVTGVISVTATASDSAGIAKVEFYRDNNILIGTSLAAPYTVNLDTTGISQGSSHTLYAEAYDANGNTVNSAVETIIEKDITFPTVLITNPIANTYVASTVTINATATDNVGVTKVEFYADGKIISTSLTAPYSSSWNTSAVTAGTHDLTAKAYDAGGNITTSATVSVIKDATAPTVSITSPAANAVVSGTVTINATAADNIAVAKVEFYIDGVLLSTDLTSPYSASWNTVSATVGIHSLTAKAYDAAGNITTSVAISVTVKDVTAPTVLITAPAAGSTVSAVTTISANASDNVGVTKVEFYVDGKLLSTDTTAPYSASWNTVTATLAAHSLTAKAYDAAGNITTSGAISVTVKDLTAPTVSITAPANNSTVSVSKTVTISATATDDRSVSKVEFYVNNVLKGTDTTSPYSYSWAVPSTKNTVYTLKAISYDSSSNKTSASITVTAK